MFEIRNGTKGPTITLTKGDYCSFEIEPTDNQGDPYTLEEGDVLEFSVRRKKDDEEVLIQKTFGYGDELVVHIENADTKDLECGLYSYKCVLTKPDTKPDTFIGSADLFIV